MVSPSMVVASEGNSTLAEVEENMETKILGGEFNANYPSNLKKSSVTHDTFQETGWAQVSNNSIAHRSPHLILMLLYWMHIFFLSKQRLTKIYISLNI